MDAHERLIESTQELLWERGYVATSPKAIQSLAGVGQGSMYHHFQGKPDLAAAAIGRSAADLRSEISAILDGPGSPLDRISAYLTRERDVLRGCRVGGLTQDPEILASDTLRAPLEATFTWLQERLRALLAEGQASGELARTVAPEELAGMICAVVQGGYVLARAHRSPDLFRQAAAGADALLRMLHSTPTEVTSGDGEGA